MSIFNDMTGDHLLYTVTQMLEYQLGSTNFGSVRVRPDAVDRSIRISYYDGRPSPTTPNYHVSIATNYWQSQNQNYIFQQVEAAVSLLTNTVLKARAEASVRLVPNNQPEVLPIIQRMNTPNTPQPHPLPAVTESRTTAEFAEPVPPANVNRFDLLDLDKSTKVCETEIVVNERGALLEMD